MMWRAISARPYRLQQYLRRGVHGVPPTPAAPAEPPWAKGFALVQQTCARVRHSCGAVEESGRGPGARD